MYALAPPDYDDGQVRMLRVDHEVWSPELQDIRGLEKVTLFAVYKNDAFHNWAAQEGVTVCRCTFEVSCRGYLTEAQKEALGKVAAVGGAVPRKATNADVCPPPAVKSSTEPLKFHEYFGRPQN